MKKATCLVLVVLASLFPLACAGCGAGGGSGDAKSSATEAASRDKAGGTTREFAIEGMTCEGCVMTLTSALKKVPGVQSVEVSLKEKKATVTADESTAPPEKIEAAIDEAGYQGKLAQSDIKK